jgi:hypothetical protein
LRPLRTNWLIVGKYVLLLSFTTEKMSLSSSFNIYVAVEFSVALYYWLDQKVSTNSYSITVNSGLSTTSLTVF